MPKRNIEKLIPYVLEVMQSKKEEKNSKFKTEFNGYFSSFGPSVIMAGLHQTVLFYENKEKCINDIIWEVMGYMEWQENKNSLKDLVLTDENLLNKKRVLDVIVACKLAIRTFKFKE